MTAFGLFLLAWAVACIGFAVHAVRRADALQRRPPRFVQWKDQPADDAAFGPYRTPGKVTRRDDVAVFSTIPYEVRAAWLADWYRWLDDSRPLPEVVEGLVRSVH